MGLDMYLYARKQAFKVWQGDTLSDERAALVACADALALPNIDNIDSISIQREVAYWRKANQIHAWFVTNVQNGEDGCLPHSCSKEQLTKLRDLCARLLVNKSEAEARCALEPVGGFFFGSTDIDDYYWQDLASTVAMLDVALAIPGDVSFVYRSSW